MSQSSPPTKCEFYLLIERKSASTIKHTLDPGRSVFLGRSDSCGVQISGEGVAEIHCLIDVDGNGVAIQDWASESGTRVNGQLVEDRFELSSGDRIQLGEVAIQLLSDQRESVEPVAATPSDSEAMDDAESTCRESSIDQDKTVESLPAESHAASPESLIDTETHSAHSLQPPVVSDPIDKFEGWPESASDRSEPTAEEDLDPEGLDEIVGNSRDADLDDWEIGDEETFDAETVNLLKSEIEDLRIQLATRDEQIALLSAEAGGESLVPNGQSVSEHSEDLVARMDSMLAEMAEHDERVLILQELLETAELQNQAEKEERNCLENWLGEIEQRIAQRESEWKAETDGLRERLEDACKERDLVQKQLQDVAKRYNAPQAAGETLERLQQQNASLQEELEKARREAAALHSQVENASNAEPEVLQEERAQLAKERADISRLRFQLSKQLSEINETEVPEAKDQPDREFAHRLRTLREHLREIHEEEKEQREVKGESLFGRISGLWKRVDDEY